MHSKSYTTGQGVRLDTSAGLAHTSKPLKGKHHLHSRPEATWSLTVESTTLQGLGPVLDLATRHIPRTADVRPQQQGVSEAQLVSVCLRHPECSREPPYKLSR